MSKLLLIGDIHGKWTSYVELIQKYKEVGVERSIQVGDYGWGFEPTQSIRCTNLMDNLDDLGGDHKYFRGNHDNPGMCAEHIHCLPDVYTDPEIGLMSVCGAWSIDHAWRTPDVDWWHDEELSYDELDAAIQTYEEFKPRVMLSHDGPESVIGHMFPWYRQEFNSRTRNALDNMLAIHQPELWVFGHWHTDCVYHRDDTKFVCLEELGSMVIDV